MIHTLKIPFTFRGQNFTEIHLSDYVKAKHKLAYAKVAKLAHDHGIPELDEDTELTDLPGDMLIKFMEFEAESQNILLRAFTEGFPEDAVGEIAEIDCDQISQRIKQVMDEHKHSYGKESQGQASGKKKTQPRKSAS